MATTSSGPVGLEPEMLSAREDVGRICLGVLSGTPASMRSLVIRVGGTFTTVVFATGAEPAVFWNLDHASIMTKAVRAAVSATTLGAASIIRDAALAAVAKSRLRLVRGTWCRVIGISNTARTVITLAAEGSSTATAQQLRDATDMLTETWAEGLIQGFPRNRVAALMLGAAILEAVVHCVGAEAITTVSGVAPAAMSFDRLDRRRTIAAQRRER